MFTKLLSKSSSQVLSIRQVATHEPQIRDPNWGRGILILRFLPAAKPRRSMDGKPPPPSGEIESLEAFRG